MSYRLCTSDQKARMPTFEEFKKEGNRAFAAKEYRRAAKIYRDAISQHGDQAVLYSNRAQCFLNLEDWQRAFKDAERGLKCGPPEKIRVKLLFRKGTAAKSLSQDTIAAACFEQLLSIDPHNAEARAELERLNEIPKTKKQKAGEKSAGEIIKIPIEIVDQLPEEFLNIVTPPLAEVKGHETVDENKTEVDFDLVDDAAEELFGKKQKNGSSKPPPVNPEDVPQQFSEMSSMHFLSALKLVSPEKKAQSYKYTANLEDSVLSTLFRSLGIDQEFFEFFLEACTFVISEDCSAIKHILAKFRLMSTFNRYTLTLTMCDRSLLDNFFSVVKSVSSEYLEQFHQVLQES